MRLFPRKPPRGLRNTNLRVVRQLDGDARYVVVAAEVDDRSVYMVWDTRTASAWRPELFETEGAAVASWLRSHPWTPEQGAQECVVCDRGTNYALAFAGTPEFVFARLRALGVAEETAHTIVQADVRLKSRGSEQGVPLNTVVGVPVCARCAGQAGLEVAMIGTKIPTYGTLN